MQCRAVHDARSFWAQLVRFAATPGGTRPPADFFEHDVFALECFRMLSNALKRIERYTVLNLDLSDLENLVYSNLDWIKLPWAAKGKSRL